LILKIEGPNSFSYIPSPIRLQIDNVEYEVPFDRFWERVSADTFILKVHNHSRGDDMIIFGLAFLNSYYTAFDIRRNQMALAPSIYSQINHPVVVSIRAPFLVAIPASLMTLVVLLFAIYHQRR